MKPSKRKNFFILILSLSIYWNSFSQTKFYTFKVPESGVYKLTESMARKLGANSISEISVYGYPGMLPQILKEQQLELQEIPSSIQDGVLYIFLEGPHTFNADNQTELAYQNHLFSDSLSYLVEVGKPPKQLDKLPEEAPNTTFGTLYQMKAYKGETTNILNSGRKWFSEPIFSGSSRTISVFENAGITGNWKIFGTLMSSSFTTSTLSVLADDSSVYETEFLPIPNTTYGVKGIEESFSVEHNPGSNRLERIRISFQSSDLNSSGYWDYIALGIPHSSEDLQVGIYHNLENESFKIERKADLNYWDISDFFNPINLNSSKSQSLNSNRIVVFDSFETPELKDFDLVTRNLAENRSSELIIIAPKIFSFAAEKLKSHKLSLGINTEIAFLDDIYDSFGYGNKDIVSIRNFLASRYHPEKSLKNVLLLGKGTFDNKGKLGGRPSLVPIYSSVNSLNPLFTFSSDDFLALLEFGQGRWEEDKDGDELMQIGIGRLPVVTIDEAINVVNKIIEYETSYESGFWKKSITYLVDDGDNNIHMRDAERHSEYLKINSFEIIQEKLYLDSFEQISSSADQNQKSPDAKKALEETLERGTLVLNYIGHGNETTLAAEEIFLVSDIDNWPKQKKMALWMTATCEFGRHDSPFLRSAAEELIIAKGKGAIGLLSTGRPVFSSVNFTINEAFTEELFKTENGDYQDLGTIFKNTKNNSLNGALNRNFSLLGDPSLKLAYPELEIEINSLQDKEGNNLSSIKAGQEIILESIIKDALTGATQISFNGTFHIEVRGEERQKVTLGNENSPFPYTEEDIVLFRGEGVATEGKISSKFILPKGITQEEFSGNLRIIAKDEKNEIEAFGPDIIKVAGSIENEADISGPEISLLLNGLNPIGNSFPSKSLFAKIDLEDISGIDISGLIPNQEISVQINGGTPFSLNNDFVAAGNGYQKGKIEVLFTGLKEGENQIIIEAWDNLGNQSIFPVKILVEGSEKLKIIDSKTFPNPTDAVSNFVIEHNRPGENFQLTISVYQTTGQAIFTESFRLIRASARIDDLSWIFFQNQTKYPAKGTYIYKLTLQSETDNSIAVASGQIVIK
ncbi:type IX secretion system sortase PorU [Algoriphagus sp. SE2]|uniref:type IX secretion system sortase PorU n=1 Tax=Algoriphagus sp. SE2 TaxID=3141536 RepID=UPI0031CD3BBE